MDSLLALPRVKRARALFLPDILLTQIKLLLYNLYNAFIYTQK